jgi:hypothetical protein
VPAFWEFNFFIKTNSREYSLFANKHGEREIWMAGFKYVIASTKTVQNIMKINS